MARGNDNAGSSRPIDFFISYSPADERWAAWIAWELESAGYRTMIQAWDFVPGTNFIDFMDRGLREAAVVIAVLSQRYMTSRYGRLEWQTALRSDPDDVSNRLVTVRVEDAPLEGLLSMITYVDLVDVTDPAVARALLLARLRQALAGRAKPTGQPRFPDGRRPAPSYEVEAVTTPPSRPLARRAPAAAPEYPPVEPSVWSPRSSVTVLHIPGPRFGRGLVEPGAPLTAGELQARIWGDLTRLGGEGAPKPDLIVVTGNLTESGSPRQFDEALTFLTGLRPLLGLEPHRIIVVPGSHDVTRPACRAYFASCEADDVEPRLPYWPKWRHFARMFDDLYDGLAGPLFDSHQPWTLFDVPDLQVVVAGLNSTMAESHLDDDHYGFVGEAQAAWFATRLRPFEQTGWLRIGAVSHVPPPALLSSSAAGPPPAFGGLGGGVLGGTTGGDATQLRDTPALDRLLGGQLNLLLHGAGALGADVDTLASGLPVVPPIDPNSGQHQLMEITAGGLTRWPGNDGAPRQTERRWLATGVTFAGAIDTTDPVDPPDAAAQPIAAPAAGGEPDLPTDPASLLLERVAEVCHNRYEHATVRRVEGTPRSLLVTYREDGIVRQLRVGGHAGELTRADVEAFHQHVHATDPDLGSELVYHGRPPTAALRDEALRRGIRLRSFTEFQGLLDLRDFVDAQTERLRTDRRYPPELYVPQRYTDLVGGGAGEQDGLVEELLRLIRADDGRFTLLLGDFGRGKTFALHEVARRIPTELPHLIPILIELRTLDKVHSVEGLVAAHLANHDEELIDIKAFRYMLREGRIVLLFDGFDELVTRVTYERAGDHLEKLLQAAEDKAKIVVASRTQHFHTHAQVLTSLGERVGLLPTRRVLSVEPFTPDQVRAFLVNRYDGDEAAADERLRLLGEIQDLLGLAQNPRMLGFIADLDHQRLQEAARARNMISAADLYRAIIGAWLTYEEERTGGVPGSPAGLGGTQLWRAVTLLAMRLWESSESHLMLTELAEVADTLIGLADTDLSPHQAAYAMGTGSLLTRTDDGMFGFIHSSVLEWLVANEIARQLGAGAARPPALAQRVLPQLSVDFLCDLADSRAAQEWTARVLADPEAGDVVRSNAIKITTRLRIPAHADLRGANLAGEDLSHRDFAGVDLTGANLTDTRLIGTNLARATLKDATLVGARLDDAQLSGADLSGADLTKARLARTDLRDITVAGSRWHRAALIDVQAAPDLAQVPELRGASIVPGEPVRTELPPPSVGVPFGYLRLPQPVAYSPDGALVATGDEDGGVLVCDSATGLPIRTLSGHRGRAYALDYGPAGAPLASGAIDGSIRLWDAATGDSLRTLSGHPDGVWPLVISPAGDLVCAGGADGVVRVWETDSGALRWELPGHVTPIYTVVYSPDGRTLATGDSAAVRIWDLAAGRLIRELTGHVGSVYRVAFNPAGDVLVAGDGRGVLRVWDPATGEALAELTGHTGRIYTLAHHPDRPLVASGDTNGGVRLWDLTTRRAMRVFTGHTGGVYQVAFSHDGSTLATGDSDGSIRIWNLDTGRVRNELAGHRGAVWPFAIRPDGRQLATSSNDGTTRLWDLGTGQCRHTLRGHGRRITGVTFSADGSMLATSGNDGIVRLWEPRTGRRLTEFTGTADRLVSAVFSPTNPLLATASNDGGIYLWNAGTGNYEREMNVETDHVWATAFSPDGEILATANDDDSVRLWYRTGREVSNLAEHRGRVRSIAFSPDGDTVATGCDDSLVRLWNGQTGECRSTLRWHSDRVYSVAFSPDGQILASASSDGSAVLWDPGSSQPRHVLPSDTGRVWSVAFSPGGRLVATADDLMIRLWDVHTGRALHTLEGHTRRIWSVAFSPDGTLLASAGDDGTVRLWNVPEEGPPTLRMTLLGLAGGWAALAPDGRYKRQGEVTGQFWHVVNMCRFEPGELDAYLPEIHQLPLDAEF